MASIEGLPTIGGTSLGNGLQELLMCDDIVPGVQPSYQTCKALWTLHPMGDKVVSAPIKMAQSQKREISVPDSPEERIKEQFQKQWKEDGCDKYIANTMKTARAYGISSIAMLVDGIGTEVPLGSAQLPLEKLWDKKISFNVFDPLNTAGSLVLNQNPNAMDFQKTQTITVSGRTYNRSRVVIVLNEEPIYIDYTQSAFGFVGRSVYQRALFPLKSFINSMITDDMVETKVGAIIYKQKSPGSIINNVMQAIAGIKATLLKQARTNNVMTIGTEEDIESINLQNLDGPHTLARRNIIENIATATPMPAKLLLQETFAEGFGEGTEDAKYVAQFIDDIREEMDPLYSFFDNITQYRAWNPEFYALIQKEFKAEYGKVPYTTALYRWRNSFTAQWPSLLREPPSEKIKVDDVKLRAALYLVEVMLPVFKSDPTNQVILISWLCDNFNELKLLFQSPLVLDMEEMESKLEESVDQMKKLVEQGGPAGENGEDGEKKPGKPPSSFADSARAGEYRSAVSALAESMPIPLRKVARKATA